MIDTIRIIKLGHLDLVIYWKWRCVFPDRRSRKCRESIFPRSYAILSDLDASKVWLMMGYRSFRFIYKRQLKSKGTTYTLFEKCTSVPSLQTVGLYGLDVHSRVRPIRTLQTAVCRDDADAHSVSCGWSFSLPLWFLQWSSFSCDWCRCCRTSEALFFTFLKFSHLRTQIDRVREQKKTRGRAGERKTKREREKEKERERVRDSKHLYVRPVFVE